METLNIVELIEKSPMTRLNKNYENKLVSKIKETFTDSQQQIFVASFYSYLNYNSKTDFVIDLDNIWKWVGYSRKNDAKKVIEKNFIIDIDFKVEKATYPFGEAAFEDKIVVKKPATEIAVAGFEVEKPAFANTKEEKSPSRNKGGAGLNKERIMLSVNTFKKFCLKANTKKADEIHDYYIKLEELLQQTINEESEELKNDLKEKETKLAKLQEAHARIVYKRNKHKLKKGKCFYILKNPNVSNSYKIGICSNMNTRLTTYNTYFEPLILYVIFTEDNALLERCIKKKYKLVREWIDDTNLEDIITATESLANILNIEYTSYRNIEELKVEDEEDSEADIIENVEEETKEDEISLIKHCKNCNTDYEYSAFNKDSSKKDGLHTTCRACEKASKVAYKDKEKSVIIREKQCCICSIVKDVSNFSQHKYTADGYVRQCHECMKNINNEKRKKDKDANVRYKCGKCNKDYARKDTLTKHQKTCNVPTNLPE
jgi:hypothetical protein